MTKTSATLPRLHTLASLRLAVLLMLSIGGAAAFATFYEMNHGTPAVQRLVYRSWWFSTLLALLAVNIAAVMLDRWPWKKHHTGFLLAHVGILLILGGSLYSLHSGLDSNMALYEGETSDRVTLFDKSLQVTLPGRTGVVLPVNADGLVVGEGDERRVQVPESDATLVIERALIHADISETWSESTAGPSVLHFVLQAPFATQDAWLVADDPVRGRLDFGPVSVSFRIATDTPAPPASPSEVGFVSAPDGKLLVAAAGRSTEAMAVPGSVDLGGMRLAVDRLLVHGAPSREVTAPAVLPREGRRSPALRIRLEAPNSRSASTWVPWGESAAVSFGAGVARVAFRAPELVVPFRVTLLRFQSKKYPGSSMPATYESRIRVDDPAAGVSEHLVSMNEPLHHRGYIFFQSSFVEGTPMASIFSVARAPGLPFVYAGTVLVGAGVAWMFYLKPLLAKRQGRKALQQLRERENARDEVVKDPTRSDLVRPAVSAPSRD